MNKLLGFSAALVFAALTLGIVDAKADTNTSTSGAGAFAAAGSSSTGVAAGNNTAVTVESSPIPTDTTVNFKNVPNVSAPGLVTTMTETCMGSWSAGAAISGLGITGGKTEVDQRCANRLDARQLDAQGYKVQAREVLCGTPEIRAAFKRVHDVEVAAKTPADQMSPICAADILTAAPAAKTGGKEVRDSSKKAVYSTQ